MKKIAGKDLPRLKAEEALARERVPVTLILDDLRSAHNVGSIFRTADAFMVKEILLCGISPKPPHREIQKSALGATESVPWRYMGSTDKAIAEMTSAGAKLVAVEHTDRSVGLQDLASLELTECAFVFGNEVNGIRQHILDVCDEALEVPMFGTKHSFNVSVCAGMILWQHWLARNRPNF